MSVMVWDWDLLVEKRPTTTAWSWKALSMEIWKDSVSNNF